MSTSAEREKELKDSLISFLKLYEDRIIEDYMLFFDEYPDFEGQPDIENYINMAITVHNSELLRKNRKKLEEKQDRLLSLQPLAPRKKEPEIRTEEQKAVSDKEFVIYKGTQVKYEELIGLCNSEKDVNDLLSDGEYDIATILLVLRKERNNLAARIRNRISIDSAIDISSEKEELERLNMIYFAVINYEKVFVDNNTKRIFVILLEDARGNGIIWNYINNSNNSNNSIISKVKKNLEKFFNGEMSGSKKIKGKKRENLWEITDTNGTRLLYFNLGNNVYVLASVFIKDAQKSMKIDMIYNNAIKLFQDQKDYILANLDNEEFWDRQSELTNELFTLLNGEVKIGGRKI